MYACAFRLVHVFVMFILYVREEKLLCYIQVEVSTVQRTFESTVSHNFHMCVSGHFL